MLDALQMWSGIALHHRFPDVVGFAVHHRPGAVNRHPNSASGKANGKGGITICIGFTFACSGAGPGCASHVLFLALASRHLPKGHFPLQLRRNQDASSL
jgi:hypothetical protein